MNKSTDIGAQSGHFSVLGKSLPNLMWGYEKMRYVVLTLLQLIKFFYRSRDTRDYFRFAYIQTYRLNNILLFRRGISLTYLGKQAFFS